MPSRIDPDPSSLERRNEIAGKLISAAAAVEKEFDADIFLLNSPMDDGIDKEAIQKIAKRRRRKNLFLILVTEGGSADCAFRIARCLQETYETFTAVVPGWCKSAGTLLCIGAHDLVMGDHGELGPLDVQLAKHDELAIVASGLTIDSAFRGLQAVAFQMFETFLLQIVGKSGGRITTKTAAELSASMTVDLLSPVFGQMDPMKIGDDFRSTRIAEAYALRLDEHSQNMIHDEYWDAIEALTRGYPSHGFVIDRTEAGSLFERVSPLVGSLAELVDALGEAAMQPTSARQTPIANYVNLEATHEPQTAETADPAPGGESASTNRSAQSDGSEPLPTNPAKGNGDFTVSDPGRETGPGDAPAAT
jgi:serine dehydrogenase proteinase